MKVSEHQCICDLTKSTHFKDPYPYDDYLDFLRTPETRQILHQMEREAIVLLENRQNILPLSRNKIKTLAVLGPQADRVSVRILHFDDTLHLT